MTGYKTIVVDDHMMVRKMVENNLNDLGIKVCETAVDGLDALEKIQKGGYDIVLADWRMPKLSGEELLRMIREDEKNNNIAFVMVTAESEPDNILKIMQLGATAYITKPFTDHDFRIAMEKVVKWLSKR